MALYDPFIAYAAPLRRGDKGPRVSALQDRFIALGRQPGEFGFRLVQPTGVYDAQTEAAVTLLQREWKLTPNGIADGRTQQVLSLAGSPIGRFHDAGVLSNPDILHILSTLAYIGDSNETPKPASAQTISYAAKAWMFFDETGGGPAEVSSYLHFPGTAKLIGNSSGVTLGPGYDLGKHDRNNVEKMLNSIGVDPAIAAQVAREAAEVTGQAARDYAEKHGAHGDRLIHLKKEQQVAMQDIYLPTYVNYVCQYVSVPVFQREFEALVSFTANAISPIPPVTSALNRGEIALALQKIIHRLPPSTSSIYKGMVNRRRREVQWFLAGRYTV
ncbi:peptidoglycan-binding protein [Terriglobus sp.]|uniref:peptidoglycan-binding protein n=1 Tax=Terriglobus sp. TaxID=1889013 RepID=UPI003AFF661C